MAYNDSHISQPTKGNEKAPLRQHVRAAMGEKVSGQSNPNGGKGSTENRIKSNAGKTY